MGSGAGRTGGGKETVILSLAYNICNGRNIGIKSDLRGMA